MTNQFVKCHYLDVFVCRHSSADLWIGHLTNVSPNDRNQTWFVDSQPIFLLDELSVFLLFKVRCIFAKLRCNLVNSGRQSCAVSVSYDKGLRWQFDIEDVAPHVIVWLQKEIGPQLSAVIPFEDQLRVNIRVVNLTVSTISVD